MNKVSRLIVLIGFLLIYNNFYAQVSNFPNVSNLRTFSDFRKSEPKLRAAIKWITNKESISNKKARKQYIDFVNEFVKKCEYLQYTPSKSLVKLQKKSEYNLQFKLGWLQYILSYEYSKNQVENHFQAFNYLISFYNKNKKDFGKNSLIEKMKKLKQKGELKKFIQSKI